MAKIVMYTKSVCPYCIKAKSLLKSKKQDITEINIQFNADAMQEMLSKSGGARTVPQIFIDDKHIGGCDELYALNDAGKLEALL